MNRPDISLAFSEECLHAALLASLLSVWALVGLFYYLSRSNRRDYFDIWTGAWAFYAVWLTLNIVAGEANPGTVLFTANQICASAAAGLLLWGSLRYLKIPVPQRLSAVIATFLAIWIVASPQLLTNSLEIHLPVFILLGLSTPFAGVCFLRLQKQNVLLGLGMLSLGFLLWVIYVGSYPYSREVGNLYDVGFCVAAILELIIAVGMIVLLFHEVRRETEQVKAEIEVVRQEKANAEQERDEHAAAEAERLRALGQMTGDVAHDMNNALSPITAYSDLLLCTLRDLPDEQKERLQRISAAAENLAQIVAHMREFYRLNPAPAAGPECHQDNFNPAPVRGKLDPDLPPEDSAASCRPLRILCIDDEPQLRELMHDVLELDHHEVTVARDGREGLDLFRSNLHSGEPYEVVITDLGMPDIDGHHVARAVKAESPRTPVIMLTGWGSMMKTGEKPVPEVDAVLGKPPRMQELSNLLFQITGRSDN